MKVKTIVTVLLLAFVAVSLGFMILREGRGTNDGSGNIPQPALTSQQEAEQTAPDKHPTVLADEKNGKPSMSPQGKKAQSFPDKSETRQTAQSQNHQSKVVVYYFHGNTRCTTCRKIESLAQEAVAGNFRTELNSGRVIFRSINVEESANEHFVSDYQLATRSVVLSRLLNDKQDAWKNLDRVWTLVRDREAFQRYVVDETKQLLGGA